MTKTIGLAFVAAVLAVLSSGCGQKPQVVTLRSLESSGKMSFVCLGRNYAPRNIDDCPDQNIVDDEDDRRLFALVTQKTRGEVAIVDLLAGSVVDEEPSVPGFNFLPVGAQPISIVSTPGGLATFVAVAEVGKEGIFALPTACIAPRKNDEPVRDITTWPACRLPSPPGEMALLVDDAESCESSRTAPTCNVTNSAVCPSAPDLSCETKQPGRRKLAVAFPELGQIGIVDAQTILGGGSGKFEPCHIEYSVPLQHQLPTKPILEQLPPDLSGPGFQFPRALSTGEEQVFSSRPAGFAQLDDRRTGERRLFVADLDAPVVHDLDTSEPCRMTDSKPPLLPASFLDSGGASSSLTEFVGRNVVTNKVAVSPLTTDGKRRYLYAIDELGGGSVMIFDVSPGSTERTPLVRPNSPRFPFEAPDRLAFVAPVQDVAFAFRDPALPDPATGVAAVGVRCDPDPKVPLDTPEAKYRPTQDYSSGANATNLRGIFGFLALSTGDLSVIDVDDFDAPCRRPRFTNASATPDFRGCSGDGGLPPELLVSGIPTVTDEASCRAVEPHRARSGALLVNTSDRGTHAPALATLPRLVDKAGRSLGVGDSTEGRTHPRMLGVNFSAPPSEANGPIGLSPDAPGAAQVYVGTTLFSRAARDGAESLLIIDPAKAAQNSLVLSFDEPRSYVASEAFAARYEGALFEPRPAGRFAFDSVSGRSTLTDATVDFCGRGVEDQALAKIRAGELDVTQENAEKFGQQHADFVRITSDLLDSGDAYWKHQQCGDTTGTGGFLRCRSLFGTSAAPSVNRELRIVKASFDTLTVESRVAPHGSRKSDTVSELIACCFPEAISYEVRASSEWIVRGSASGFRHNVITADGSDRACMLDPSSWKQFLRSRVVEVSCNPASTDCAEEGKTKSIGLANAGAENPAEDVACVVQHPSTETQTISRNAPCIYTGLSANFVIYRGQLPSERDMEFVWEVRGGFTPLTVSLGSTDPNSTLETMVFFPELGALVIDGASKGLVVIDLGGFGITQYY